VRAIRYVMQQTSYLQTVIRFLRSTPTFLEDDFFDVRPIAIAVWRQPDFMNKRRLHRASVSRLRDSNPSLLPPSCCWMEVCPLQGWGTTELHTNTTFYYTCTFFNKEFVIC